MLPNERTRDPSGPIERLTALLERGSALVLTGAGVSTESGIPDYRDERGNWKRSPPIQIREFTGSDASRRRYWARSLLGFRVLGQARPNRAHLALADLERQGRVAGIVTQNVDGLHQAAGARDVVDLHGRIDQVVCLSCGEQSSRSELQRELARLNPEWTALPARVAPDGDADPGELDTSGFQIPDCTCGGMLKPDVVFFGENVPKARVESAMATLERASSLLVVGSSLMVFSGYRFVRAAERLGIPVAVVNRGHTRADGVAHVKVDGDAASTLDDVVRRLA